MSINYHELISQKLTQSNYLFTFFLFCFVFHTKNFFLDAAQSFVDGASKSRNKAIVCNLYSTLNLDNINNNLQIFEISYSNNDYFMF